MALADYQKPWSCVGSAGVADSTNLPKLIFSNSTVQLGPAAPGIVVENQATVEQALPLQTVMPVLRYGVVAVDGIEVGSGVTVCYRNGSGRVVVKLIQVAIATGTETTLTTFDSNSFPQNNLYQVQSAAGGSALDFQLNAYYMELTLSDSVRVGQLPRYPPFVSVIQISGFFN